MENIVCARTRKILENSRLIANSFDPEDDEEVHGLSEFSEAEDVLEIEEEEGDEITIDLDDNSEEFQDVSDIYISKDETYWLKKPLVRRRARLSNIIRSPPGVSSNVDKNQDLLYFFKLFLSPEIIDIVVKYTNQRGKYETEKFNENTESDPRQWIEIDEQEIYAFIGLLICTGATKSTREPVRMLWMKDLCFQRPIYPATMSRSRFSHISAYLRFDDMHTREERKKDKLAPIREIVELFTTNCQTHYNTGSHLTIDERLLPFRGNAPGRVYMKTKPGKYGMKIWIMTDSATSYCKNLQVYLGKIGKRPEKQQGKRVVLDLVSILGAGYGITTTIFLHP